jgi:hypothetical protein
MLDLRHLVVVGRESHTSLKRIHMGSAVGWSKLLKEWQLPLLHEFTCAPFMVEVVALINFMILSPQLRSLSLGPIDVIEDTLATLPSIAASKLLNLTNLSFSCYGDPSTVSLTTLLLRCPRLISLEISDASIEHMYAITSIATTGGATSSMEAKEVQVSSSKSTSSRNNSSNDGGVGSVIWHDLQSLTFTEVPYYSCLTKKQRHTAIVKHNEKARKHQEEYKQAQIERRRKAARTFWKEHAKNERESRQFAKKYAKKYQSKKKKDNHDKDDDDGEKDDDDNDNDEDNEEEDQSDDDHEYDSDPYYCSSGDDEPNLVEHDDTPPLHDVTNMMVDIIINCPSLSRLTIYVETGDEYAPRDFTAITLMQRIRTRLTKRVPSRHIALITKLKAKPSTLTSL